jgi:hypothetical protein
MEDFAGGSAVAAGEGAGAAAADKTKEEEEEEEEGEEEEAVARGLKTGVARDKPAAGLLLAFDPWYQAFCEAVSAERCVQARLFAAAGHESEDEAQVRLTTQASFDAHEAMWRAECTADPELLATTPQLEQPGAGRTADGVWKPVVCDDDPW